MKKNNKFYKKLASIIRCYRTLNLNFLIDLTNLLIKTDKNFDSNEFWKIIRNTKFFKEI